MGNQYLLPPPKEELHMRPPYVCPQCGRKSEMCWRHDAYYCPSCDIWLEEACSSPWCSFCVGRPERPSQVEPDPDEEEI